MSKVWWPKLFNNQTQANHVKGLVAETVQESNSGQPCQRSGGRNCSIIKLRPTMSNVWWQKLLKNQTQANHVKGLVAETVQESNSGQPCQRSGGRNCSRCNQNEFPVIIATCPRHLRPCLLITRLNQLHLHSLNLKVTKMAGWETEKFRGQISGTLSMSIEIVVLLQIAHDKSSSFRTQHVV